MSDAKKLIFAGTPEFAASALQALLEKGHQVVAVYTQPDRPAGRGHKMTPSPVKVLAQQHQIPVEQPQSFRDPETVAHLADYDADLMIVAAYGLILPQAVLDTPTLGCLNIHASLLPRWRGAAPIQRAIQAGDNETGITIMQMEAGLDTGPMLLKTTTAITSGDTGGSLHDRLAQMGGDAIVQALDQLASLQPEVQDDTLANYARKLSKAESQIDWGQPATSIERTIRAFNPWPGTSAQYQDKVVKIWQASPLPHSHDKAPGTILGRAPEGIEVACGKGSLLITRLQWPGAKAIATADFVNGNPNRLLAGEQFHGPGNPDSTS